MVIGQVDIKTAFLNGALDEDVWGTSPRVILGRPSRLYKLKKALYGLKQAHLSWHKRLREDLAELEYEELPHAPCVFRRHHTSGQTFILVYVDDLIIISHNDKELSATINDSKWLYELRICPIVDFFLGVKLQWVQKSENQVQLFFNQRAYIKSILRRFRMNTCKLEITPMVECFFRGLQEEEDKCIDEEQLYQQIVGCLLFISLRTRPHILVSTLILARFQNKPTAYCYRAAIRVLRYLQGTREHGILYKPGTVNLEVYVNDEYAGDSVDQKSLQDFISKVGNMTIYWGLGNNHVLHHRHVKQNTMQCHMLVKVLFGCVMFYVMLDFPRKNQQPYSLMINQQSNGQLLKSFLLLERNISMFVFTLYGISFRNNHWMFSTYRQKSTRPIFLPSHLEAFSWGKWRRNCRFSPQSRRSVNVVDCDQ